MRKLFFIIVFIPVLVFSQYYYERSTEQNFETSDFYFNRYLLNPYGMHNFREVTPALIENPFLNIFVNPAKITELKEKFKFYIDYRGDRKLYRPEIFGFDIPLEKFGEVLQVYPTRPYPFYVTQARFEPEPKFSVGVITSPINSLKNKFFVGATFQRIHKAEQFYSMPYWIYFPVHGYDPFGNKYAETGSYPVIDRFIGKDEMVTLANLFSLFTGYKLFENFSIGLQLSKINHSREGGYRHNYNDDYDNIDNRVVRTDYLIDKLRDYKQTEYVVGINYSENLSKLGIKFGVLNGNAGQVLHNYSLNFYQRNKPDISPNWYRDTSYYRNDQNWNNSGNMYFGGFDVLYPIDKDIQLIGYFNYLGGKISFQNSSFTSDTSDYYHKYNYNLNGQNYWDVTKNSYLLLDNRTGAGTKTKSDYSGLIGLRWNLSPTIKITFALAYFEARLDVKSIEPAIYEAISKYDFATNNPKFSNFRSYLRVFEDKRLEWHYNSVNFSYQIPVFFDFKLSEKFELTVLVNQISGGTKISEYTNVFINKRIRTENDSTKQSSNFVERYLNPKIHKTFDKTDLIGHFRFNLHPNLNINFLIDPELIPFINVAQWWFSIEGKF